MKHNEAEGLVAAEKMEAGEAEAEGTPRRGIARIVRNSSPSNAWTGSVAEEAMGGMPGPAPCRGVNVMRSAMEHENHFQVEVFPSQ